MAVISTFRSRRSSRLALLAATAAFALGALAACAPASSVGGDIVAPVTMTVNELQGAEVELPINSFLYIDTQSLDVDSYTAEVADPSIVRFEQGKVEGDATFTAGFTPLKEGTTAVTMTNEQGGIQPLEFTITVVPRTT